MCKIAGYEINSFVGSILTLAQRKIFSSDIFLSLYVPTNKIIIMENHNDQQINSDQTNYQIVEYVADGNTQQSVSETAYNSIWPPIFDETEFQLFPNAALFEAAGMSQPVPVEIVTFQNESELKAYLDTQSASETTIWPTIFNESELQLFPNASPFEADESQPNPAECATFQTDSDLKAFLDTLPVEEVLKTFQEHYPSSEWPDSTIPQCVSDFRMRSCTRRGRNLQPNYGIPANYGPNYGIYANCGKI